MKLKNLKKLKDVIQKLESEKIESSKIDNNQDSSLEDFISFTASSTAALFGILSINIIW